MSKIFDLKSEVTASRGLWLDMLAMLALPAVSAWYYYGTRTLLLLFVSIVTACLVELAAWKITRQPPALGDFNAVFIGAAIALMLPASAPVWLPMLGSAFAVAGVKLPFGKTGETPFSPAAAAMAFLSICFSNLVFSCPRISVGDSAQVYGSAGFSQGTSLASMLSQNTSVSLNIVKIIDVFSGNFPAPMGTGCIIILLGSALYFIIRRTGAFVTSAGFITGAALIAVIFPRIMTGRLASVVLELSAGYLLFAALFLITEPGPMPKKPLHRLFYGMFAGALCIIMRRFGAYEESAAFAVLIANAVWAAVEKYFDEKSGKTKKAQRPKEVTGNV